LKNIEDKKRKFKELEEQLVTKRLKAEQEEIDKLTKEEEQWDAIIKKLNQELTET